jgi:uncharacterized protein (DUF2236 family)
MTGAGTKAVNSKWSTADDPAPLGPDSLTWRYFGLMIGFTAGTVPQLLQVMHPVLGHAVDEHSNVKEDPFGRFARSMGPIYGVIYDGPQAPETARTVRGFHEAITGTLPSGERYSALNPEVFHWKQWYRLYGMTMRNVPETLDDFDAYWDRYVDDVLEYTPAAQWLLATFKAPPVPPPLHGFPEPLWRPLGRVIGYLAVVFASGQLPPVARDKLRLPYGLPQRIVHDVILRAVRWSVPLTPARFRYHRRSYAAWQQAAQQQGVRAATLVRRASARGRAPAAAGGS